MTSAYIKAALLAKLRFVNRCPYVATEVGGFSADVCAINKNKLTEYEVKISMSDFKADFNKPKHVQYRQLVRLTEDQLKERALTICRNEYDDFDSMTESAKKYRMDIHFKLGPWIPHFFYYAVPEEIADAVGAKLLSYSGYGLVVVKRVSNTWRLREAPVTIIRAKQLHCLEISQTVYSQFLYRMGSELASRAAKGLLEKETDQSEAILEE